MRLYVASSWRNDVYESVLKSLRDAGHDCYDFKDPKAAFNWSEIDPWWESWSPQRFRKALSFHVLARRGFKRDFDAMKWAEACVLVLPCGRSAHLEGGWFVGARKPLYILLSEDQFEPELMYKMATNILITVSGLLDALPPAEASA